MAESNCCTECGVTFVRRLGGRGRRQIYCSLKCKDRAKKKKIKSRVRENLSKFCEGCKAPILAYRKTKKHCSACNIKRATLRSASRKKACLACGIEISIKAERCASCSVKAKKEKRDKRSQRVCQGCGATFVRKRRHKGEGEKYCSRQCAFDAKRKEPITYVELTLNRCVACNKEWLARRERSACSRECELVIGRERYYKQNPLKEVICAGCEMPFLARGNTRKYCSRKCRKVIARTKRVSYQHRTGMSWEAWSRLRLRVLARDGYVCHYCGIKTNARADQNDDTYPNLDHVIPLAHGGPTIWLNLRCSCRACNLRKSGELDDRPYSIAEGKQMVWPKRKDDGWMFMPADVHPEDDASLSH